MEFDVNIVKEILEKYGKNITESFSAIAKKEWEKFKIDFGYAFAKYCKNSYEKYSKIKTILYRTEPKYIYNFYEHPTLTKNNAEDIDSSDVNNILELSNFIVISGMGGIGKSTLMKHLFINELKKDDLIPIFIELKEINERLDDYDFKEFIFNRLSVLGVEFNDFSLDYALKSGCFLLLLDGYDEINSANKSRFLAKLEDFCDKYSENHYILSSRPYTDFIEFQRFTVLKIKPFSKEQSISLIRKIDYEDGTKERFIKELSDNLYDSHKSFASNPLLLNIMLLTYDNYAGVPDKLHLFYENAFETLYSKHDATKSGYKRELKSKLSFDEFKKIFASFCFISYSQSKVEFTYSELATIIGKFKGGNFNVPDFIDDIVNSICVLYREGDSYIFTHRSFQEYFTAVFFKELTDTNMKNMFHKLMQRETHFIVQDTTFDMLYDMTKERVEQNIILPILLELENGYDGDKYDLYFGLYKIRVSFSKTDKGQNRTLALRAITDSYKIDTIQKFAMKNFSKYSTYSNKDFKNYIFSTVSSMNSAKFNGDEILADKKAYELFKETWIGKHIRFVANWSEMLIKEQERIEINLDSLFE